MKKLLLLAATSLTLTGAAMAQTATEAPADDAAASETTAAPAADAVRSDPGEAMQTGLMRASALDGVDIYTVDVTGETHWEAGDTFTEIDANWEKIGELEDLVLDGSGTFAGAIAEVGGFLGLGEKEVVLQPDEIAFVVTEDRIAVVSGLGKEQLEQREETAEEIRDED